MPVQSIPAKAGVVFALFVFANTMTDFAATLFPMQCGGTERCPEPRLFVAEAERTG
jgi:hypothetical protein